MANVGLKKGEKGVSQTWNKQRIVKIKERFVLSQN